MMDSKKTKILLTVAVAALLLLGITGMARFPAIYSETRTTYPRDYTDDGSFVGVTRCSRHSVHLQVMHHQHGTKGGGAVLTVAGHRRGDPKRPVTRPPSPRR